jgi:mannosyltransferase PIG-V
MAVAAPSPRSVLLRLTLLCAAIRVVLEAIGLASVAAHGKAVWSNALQMWTWWDAHHYLRLAEVGYVRGPSPPPNSDDPLYIVFFPFFPVAVRLVWGIVRNAVFASLVVSFAASVGAGYFLHRLVALDANDAEAWRAVVLLYAFPTAYFMAAPYTEALFLFAVVASIYAARTGRWVQAGLSGALATGTRVTGVALFPALVAEALSKGASLRERLRRFAWIGVAGAGLLIYLVVNQVVHGDPLWFLHVQRQHWFQYAVPPWRPVIDAYQGLRDGTDDPTKTFIFSGRLAGVAFAVPILALATKRLRAPDVIYAWAGFVLILSASWLLSLPRYLIVLYPIFMVGAKLLRSPRVLVPLVVASAVVQGWLMWRFAVGQWTF